MCDFNNDFSNDFLIKGTMSKQNLLDIVNGIIANQGNQLDMSGALANVLNAIIADACPLEVSDITKLTGEQLDALGVGAKVVKVTGTQKHLYSVTYKDEDAGELLLTYADWQNVEGVYYEKGESGWAYVQTDNTHIAQ